MKPININEIESDKEILVLNEHFKTIYFKFEEGKGLPNHSHNGAATIQVINGVVNIEFNDGNRFKLVEGDFLSFDARIEHNVIAEEESKVLVTIEKSPSVKNVKILKA